MNVQVWCFCLVISKYMHNKSSEPNVPKTDIPSSSMDLAPENKNAADGRNNIAKLAMKIQFIELNRWQCVLVCGEMMPITSLNFLFIENNLIEPAIVIVNNKLRHEPAWKTF